MIRSVAAGRLPIPPNVRLAHLPAGGTGVSSALHAPSQINSVVFLAENCSTEGEWAATPHRRMAPPSSSSVLRAGRMAPQRYLPLARHIGHRRRHSAVRDRASSVSPIA